MKPFIRYISTLTFGMTLATPLLAEDIEIYVGSETHRQGSNAKVMIIFDNSGSMRALEEVKKTYDASATYNTSGFGEFSRDAIYFSRGEQVDSGSGAVPKGHSDSRRFNMDILGCETAWEKLRTVGYYTGYLREYQVKGNSGSWEPLPAEMGMNTNNPVDCYDDIANKQPENGTYSSQKTQIPNSYPYNGTGNAKNDLVNAAYTTDWELANSQGSALQGGQPITLYTANYINYYHATTSEVGTESKTRLEIAKETINELLSATPGVDFGMMLFNLNAPYEGDRDGGRIVSGINKMTDANRAALLATLQEIDAETNTPLCESLMETKRYYAGETVDYGKKDSNANNYGYIGNTPPRDQSIESGNKYESPYDACADVIYTILITDGEPTVDNHADAAIKALEGTLQPYKFKSGKLSYLPVLASWMLKNDINPSLPGKQISKLYTIGFGEQAVDDAGELLKMAADYGGGQYFAARNASALTAALQATLMEILRVNTSFTAPSVASNNFDRTRSLDTVYYAMFLPDSGPRWSGNIKKLKLKGSTLVDKNDNPAMDENGAISDAAVTFWNSSNSADGNRVAEGGVAAQLRVQEQRKLLVNLNNSLKELAFSSFENVAAEDVERLKTNIAWARGVDVDDDNNNGSTTDLRSDIMGDPLHSKPLVLNYGNGDLRILVGTNTGFLHMFKDSGNTVSESWAFMPQELMKNIPELRVNQNGAPKVYGVDSAPVAYFRDLDGDGIIGSDDKVWLFFGLRRGGNSYYALDITNPDQPKLLWKIDSSTTGFEELGQSWSKPTVAFVKPNGDKPVLMFGAGFDTNKDGRAIVSPDSKGRGMFIVDAQSGNLIRAFHGAVYGGEHSVPGGVAWLDSDIDGYADRLYFADTGGDVWRADLAGDVPSAWTVYKFASLSSGIQSEDRRFFYEPAVASTINTHVEEIETIVDGVSKTMTLKTEVPFDAVVLGSGSRPHPLFAGVQDKLFMLRDVNTITQLVTVDTTPSTITVSDLYEVVDTTPRTKEELLELQKDLSAKKGWFFNLGPSEKALSSPLIIGGVAYFTSYTPISEQNEDENCTLKGGISKIYAFHLHFATFTRTIPPREGPILDTPTTITIEHDPKPDPNPHPNPDDPELTLPPKIHILGVGDGCGINGGCEIETQQNYVVMDEPGQL